MGVIDKTPGYGEDGLYLFSSRPVTPRDKGGDIMVKFQAVSRTHQTLSHHYIAVSSNDRLSHVRRSINVHFKDYFDRGFIFLCKTREILRANEKTTTVFDILPKIPQMCSLDQGRSKSKWELPMKNFRYPDVEYKRVLHTYDGKRYIVMCACVIFLYERSKVSHWPPSELRQQLCENLLDGFSFIPTDIISWKPKLIELKATILHLNAACGNIKELEDAIQKLPKTPNITDICDERNATPLHYAAENGKLDACEILVNGIGRDQIYAKDINGKSPLHCALYRRRKGVIVYLLQLNAEVQDVDNMGNSCLDLLLLQRNVDVEYIASNLEAGSLDRHLQFYLCYLMLYMQKEKHSLRIMQTLPDYDMFDHSLFELGCSLLHLSSKLSPRLTDVLLVKHFPKDEGNLEGNLPFHTACQWGNVEQINLLYDEKFSDADLNKGIQIALRNRHFKACEALKKLGSNLLLHETTVCMIMESLNKTFGGFRKGDQKRKHVEFVAEKLLPLLSGQNGAAEQYVFETVFLDLHNTLTLLKSLGIPFDLSDEMGRTPLHEACQKNHKECVHILLKGGAKSNVVDWRGATPLHYACEKGHDAIVKILLQSDQKVNLTVQDDSGRTPLMTAIYRNQHKVVRVLLQNYSTKCNLQAVDSLGQSILYYLPFIEEDLEDTVIQSFRIEKPRHQKRNKGIQHEKRNILWNGSVTFTDFCMFERPFRELNMKEEDPFQYDNKHAKPWNELWPLHKKNPKLIASPSKRYKKCQKCNRIIKSQAKHICSVYDSENQDSVVTVKAFEFHHHVDQDVNIPLQCALKLGRLTTFKKLAQNFPNLLKDVDSLRRSILYFALQQCSVKVIKPVVDVVKPKSDFLHHLMMFARNGKILATQKVVEYFVLSGLSTNDIPEPTDVIHNFCGYEKNHRRCDLNCYMKSHPAIEAAVIMQNFPIFNAVLEKTKEEHLGIALHLAVYFGQCRFIEAILRKKQKRETSKEIQKIEEMYILDIACRSPNISDKVFETLLKYQPEILESREIFTCDDLSEFRPHVWENMNLLHMNEKTILAKLLSTEHSVRNLHAKRTKTDDRLKMIDKAGCLLIRSGVQLGKFEISEESEDSCIHGICEALLPALKSRHFNSAAMMIQKEGHILWHCALSKSKCNIQKQFAVRWEPKANGEKEFTSDHHVMIDYIKYVLMFACQKRIPENILLTLIQSGMEVEGMQTTDIPDKEFALTERLYALNGCKSPIEKIMRCVLEIVTGGICDGEVNHREYRQYPSRRFPRRQEVKTYRRRCRQDLWIYAKNYKFDILRLLKFAPGAVTCFGKSNIKPLVYLMLSKEELRLLRDCTMLMNLSGQSDCVTFPSGTTLLHLACCTGNVEFVKMMLQAPFPVKIDEKTKDGIRPLDLAVIYGSWDIYKFLVENGANFTSETSIACCSDDRYKNVKSWTERIRNMRPCEKPSAKTKKRILADLYERKKIDWNSFDKKSGGPLHNAIDCHLDDIVIYLIDVSPSLLITALNYDPNVAAQMQKCKEGTIAHVFNAMAIQVSKLEIKVLGQLILHTAISRRKNLMETLTKTCYRVINQEQWEKVVTEADKHGRNVFHFVAMFGWENIARQLIQVVHREYLPDFPLNEVDLAGASPLWYALAFKQWKTAELYLLNGASPILQRAIPGCFTKKSKPVEMIDLCFHECEHSNTHTSFKGIKMSTRRKVKLSRDQDVSVINCLQENDISSKEKYQIKTSAVEVSNTKVTFRPKYSPSMLRHKTQKRIEYLLKKAYLSKQLGYSLIHFASRTGDIKLFEDIISISEEKLKFGGHYVEAGYMFAILGGHAQISDTYRENDIHLSKEETFHSIVWQTLRTEDIQKNVHHFLSSMLSFVFNNTVKSDNRSVPREKVVPIFHGFSYKLNKHKFEEHLANLHESLTEQVVEQTLIDQMESTLQYIYHRLYNKLMERQSFATLENNPQRSDVKLNEKNLTNFLKSVDANTKIDEKDILLLLSMNQPWVISSLISASKINKTLFHLMKRQLLWGLNILDCIVISLPKDYGRSDKVLLFQQDISDDIGALVNQFDMGLQETTVLYASNKNLWTVLRLVAIQQIPKERELKVCWQMSLAHAVRSGQLDFVKSIVDNISISKLPEAVQASFAALLCNGAFYGQTGIVKYLFRKSVPIKFDTESPMFVDLMDKIHVKKFDVIEYAIRSKRPETVDAVIKFCKYDREFMKNAKPESYFELAAANGNWQIMKYFIDLFTNTGQPSKQVWEKFFIEAARRGQEDFCGQVLGFISNVDVFCVDKTNKHILHYCGIYNMKNVAHQVLEKTPHGLDLSDSDGMRPIDYAVVLGNIEVVNLFMKTKLMHSKENIDSVETYGWFRFLMDQINTDDVERSEVIFRPVLPKSRTLDLLTLYRKGDDNAAAAFVSCSKHIPKLLLENPANNGIFLHDAIRYGCIKTFHNIMGYFAGEEENIRQVLKIQFKGLSPLAVAVSSSQYAIAEYVFMYDDGLSWKSKKSAENILHLAIHTGDPNMIELVASKTLGRLCDEKDICGYTPVMYLCALGLQDYYVLLKTETLLDPLIDSHVGHKDDDPDMACLNCLLNRCIGWSKIYSRAPLRKETQPMRSVKNALPPPLLKEYFWKLGKYRTDSPLITSIMIACGYTATYSSLVKIMSRGEGIQKMISVEGVEKTLDEFQSKYILENILEISIVAKNEAVFVELLDHASGLNDRLKRTHGISIFEAVIGLSRLNLLVHLKEKLNFQDDDFSTFKEIYSTLPQKQRWISELDHIGGKCWPHFESSSDRHEPRILKPDLWLIESMTLPESIRQNIEAKSVKESIIPSDYSELKYTTDLDSFRKLPHFMDFTDIWIQCFLTSSLVLSHIQDIKNCQDSKFISAKSIKVACLAHGTTDHPKVTIDSNGALLNQIRVFVDKGVSSVRHDRSFCQRPEEIRLKADVDENVIPFFENFIQKEFGLNLKIKIDWNAIELRKRTYNTEVIMKSLNGEIYGNKLGGLDDVLKECKDMKDDIESMFDKETVEYALRDVMNFTGITVSFDDKVTSQQASYSSGHRHILSEVVWKFTITQSRLYYDRSEFPLWQYLTIYRSICASTCHSVYCISNINASLENNHNDRKNRPLQSISFEVDLQSFGITDLSILRTLMCRDVGREFVAIAYDCSAMLWLKNTSKKVLLKSTISLQHTGVTFQDDTTIIHICCNETNSKEWIVERSNSFSRLADAEDRQLIMEWPASYSQELNQKAIEVQNEVQDKVGIAITFQADEKRLMLACFSKFRREMRHPHDVFKLSMTTSYQEYGNVYIQILEDLLLLQKYPAIKQNHVEKGVCGVWIRMKQRKSNPELLLLTKQLAKKNLLSSFESPKYNILPIIKTENFEIVSESDAKTQFEMWKHETLTEHNQSEMWKHETLTEHNQSDLSIEAVSIQGHVFTFSDANFFNKSIANLPLRAVISQDTAHALERGYCHILHTKVVDNIRNDDYPMGETFELHYQAKERIRKLLNIRNVEIEWASFVFKSSLVHKQNFAVCLNTVVDSFLEIFPTAPECIITQRVVLEMHSLFSGVSGLRIAMQEKIHSDDDNEGIERTISPDKNRSPAIRILKGNILEIIFKRSEKVTTFADLLCDASIQLAEIKIKSLLGCRDRKENSNNSPEKVRKQTSKFIILPSSTDIMLCLGDIKLALSAVSSSIKSFMTIVPDEVDEVYFVSSKRKTGFVLRSRTLLYNVSKMTVTPTDLANQLQEEFGFQGLKTPMVVPDLSVNDPPIFNKGSSTLEVTMTINDYNKETADVSGHLNLTNSDDYKVTLQGFSEALKVSAVDQRGEHLVLTVPVAGDKIKVYNTQCVLVHHKYARPENCKTFIFDSRSTAILRHQYPQDTINEISVKKNEALEFLIEHKTKITMSKDPHEINGNEGKHETVFQNRKIRFNFYYQKKRFPSSEPTLPFTLQSTSPGRRYSPVPYSVYSLLINDSKRHFTMSAQCLCCNQNLNIITRFGKMDASRELRVNCLES